MSARSWMRRWGWLALVGALIGGLWAASPRPPRLPADADHGLRQSEVACLHCHNHAGKRPRPADHPPRDDCFSCHRDAAGALHPRRDAATTLPGGWAEDPRR